MSFNMDESDWDDVIRVHLKGHFAPSHHAAIYWRGRAKAGETVSGHIINTSSEAGLYGNAGQANYSAAKAGMIGLTKALAREFASRGVTVNAVAPGFIKTDMTTEFVGKPEVAAKILEAVPLKRFGEAADISSMCAYLCSEESGYVTGQVFTVDGGMAM